MDRTSLWMTLRRAAELTGGRLCGADGAQKICRISSSSRGELAQGLFVAIEGFKLDGHDFIGEAFDRGALAAVVTESGRLGPRPGIVVQDSRRALSQLAAELAGRPAGRL